MAGMVNRISIFSAVVVALLACAVPADARRGEQDDIRQDLAAGKFRQIESSVVNRMRGKQYLGPEYDPRAQVIRFKFIDGNKVIFVDVDAKTGDVLSQR